MVIEKYSEIEKGKKDNEYIAVVNFTDDALKKKNHHQTLCYHTQVFIFAHKPRVSWVIFLVVTGLPRTAVSRKVNFADPGWALSDTRC